MLTKWTPWPLLEDDIPLHSSAAIVNYVHERLLVLCQSSVGVFEPVGSVSTIAEHIGQTYSQQASALSSISFNTAVCAVVPDKEAWNNAYVADSECWTH